MAAADLGIDRIALRRRNVIRPADIPYRTPIWLTYDAGHFEANLDVALPLVDWDGFEIRRAAAAAAGKLRGRPVLLCRALRRCSTRMRHLAHGRVTVLVGTMASGQGHVTAYAQIVAEMLGLPIEQVDVIQGDTDRVKHGQGTAGRAAGDGRQRRPRRHPCTVIDKAARAIASHLLETAEADIEFQDGVFSIVGTDRRVGFRDVAAAAHDPARLPAGTAPGLDAIIRFQVGPPIRGRPPRRRGRGRPRHRPAQKVVGYTVVHDFRRREPATLGGQVHGGVAQGGPGAARARSTTKRPAPLRLVMDYCVPRADDVPISACMSARTRRPPTRSASRGGRGRLRPAGAPPAIVNAVIDALKLLGIRHVDMPLTSERLWRTIHRG